jgi:hypothetical protein
MCRTSVKAPQLRPDADLPPQGAREHAAFACAVEAGEVAARVRAAARLLTTGYEDAVAGGKPQ